MKLIKYLTLGLLVLLITITSSATNVFCQNDKLDKIMHELESDDSLKRRTAQNDLTDYLENIRDEAKREDDIHKLLLKIFDKTSSNRLRAGIAYSIGRIRTFFWEVKDQKQAESNLYELSKQTKDPLLKKYLDTALMKEKGLYWDAIKDYNEGYLGRRAVNEAVAKFERVFNEFPESDYASRAHYYLARYYTRVYLKRKESDDNRVYALADKNGLIAEKSNSTYQNYFEKINKGKYESTDLMNARYYLALNWVLLGKFDNAIKELNKIVEDDRKDKYTIYVYEFYYSKDDRNAIDRYFSPDQLALYTIRYLKEHPTYNEDYKKSFEDYLNKFALKD